MKRRNQFVLLMFLMLIGVINTSAQLLWDTVHLQNEISPNYTKDIVFDNHHFLWISTARGLYRVDGNEARYYVHNPEDTLSLMNNNVTSVYEDVDHDLWILTDKGVQSYSHKTETFKTILKDYVELYKSHLFKYGFQCALQVDTKHILFGTKDGCVLYNKVDRTFTYFPLLESTNSTGYSSLAHVIDIVKNPKDNSKYYLLTRSGIYSFNSITQKINLVSASKKIKFFDIGSPGMTLLSKGDFLYFTIRKEVYSYQISTKQFHKIGMDIFTNRDIILRDIIQSKEHLIISTANNGIYQASFTPPHQPTLINDGQYNQLTLSPNGLLTTIASTKDIVLSQDRYIETPSYLPLLTIDKVWVNDNRKRKRDVFADTIYHLRDFERNLDFQISLNQYENAQIQYSYQLDNSVWSQMGSDRKLSLQNIYPGEHKLIFKANYQKKEILSEVLYFHVDRFFYEQWWFRALVLSTIFLFLLSIYYLLRSLRRNREQYQKQVIEMELNALRSQMNPHFLFNTLNSIKNYVLTKSPDDAAYYLTKFSQLIRSILENSKVPFLTLQQELDSIKLYIEMEHLRFGGEFTYDLHIDENIDVLRFKIAPLLIQPFIENAIWHGLMNIKTDRRLTISFNAYNNGVLCSIEDNGIGLSKSKELQAKRTHHKKSLGLDITLQRIKNINILYNIEAHVDISDRLPCGTKVSIYLPTIAK